jgi:hypothetical protein
MASSQLRSTIARRVYRSRTIRYGARSSPPVRRSPGTRNLACFCDSFISQRIGLAANPTFLWGLWRVSTIWAFEVWRSRRTEVTECTEVPDLNTEPRSSRRNTEVDRPTGLESPQRRAASGPACTLRVAPLTPLLRVEIRCLRFALSLSLSLSLSLRALSLRSLLPHGPPPPVDILPRVWRPDVV